jgi:hypothetical protein
LCSSASDDEDIEPALEQAMRSFVVIKANVRKGRASTVFTECGVAVSATQAIAAMHGQVAEGSRVTVVTRTGAQLSGTVGFMRYTPDVVDIAVVDHDEGLTFKIFTACATERVRIKQDLAVVGLEAGEHDDSERCADLCRVLDIPPGSSLLHCAYYQYNDASGAGVVTARKGGELYVVGPHVAAKPATASADDKPPHKKAKTGNAVQVSSRGHCVVCEVNRVEGLVDYLGRTPESRSVQL